MKNHAAKKVDASIQYNGEDENSDMYKEISIKKPNLTIFQNNGLQNKIIFNERKALDDNENSIFSNVEIKKYVNDNDKINTQKTNDYLHKKLKNTINYIYNANHGSLTMNKKYNKEFLLNSNKILKEESTNTFINNLDSDNLKLDSSDSNKININSKRLIFLDKISNKRFNNNNNNYIFNDNTKVFNENKNNKIKRKVNNIYNLSIDNNINFNQERINNNIKNYFELYNFHLLQSLIQNRSNLFKLKNNSLFNKNKFKNLRSINLSHFLSNTNINNINNTGELSLREFYRNLNKDKLSLNILKINSIKKDKLNKERKKTFENNNNNNKINKNIFDKKVNHKLMNVQYILDGLDKNKKNINKGNLFQKTIFEKRFNNINKNIAKSENKSEYQSRKYIKTSTNFHQNILSKQFNPTKDDILDRGLSNSPPYIKTLPKHNLIKIKNNKNIFSNLKIKI